MGGGGKLSHVSILPFLMIKEYFFIFSNKTLGLFHEWGSIKEGYLFYYGSFIKVSTRFFSLNAWLNLPPPNPHIILTF